MVPVGGAIVFSPSTAFIDCLSAMYPGRASAAPVLDLFITLLSMGVSGYRQLLQERLRLHSLLYNGLEAFADRHKDHEVKVLNAKNNSISIAVALGAVELQSNSAAAGKDLSFFGSMLFSRNVSGCRVISCNISKATDIAGYEFYNWGAHSSTFPYNYFTVACSIGTTQRDVDVFLDRLEKTILKFYKKQSISVPEKIVGVTAEQDLTV